MTSPEILDYAIRNIVAGQNTVIVQPCNIYDCTLGDNVFVGPFVEIQKGVVIGARTRIQSHTFICELVNIGTDCSIAHGVMFINDPFKLGRPARRDKTEWKPTLIGDHVCIGSNATVMPVMICSHVVIGAGSVVTKNIDSPGIYAGNPARKMRKLP